MSATGGRSGDVAEVRQGRRRPRMRVRSIAELERDVAMKRVRKEETRCGGGENSRERMECEMEEVERGKKVVEVESIERDLMSEDEAEDNPKPVGRSTGLAARGGKLYAAFERDGKHYGLEDAVVVAPEDLGIRPGVAIIKEIRQAVNGYMFASLRWLYRATEVNIKVDLYDPRELLFSDHKEEVPAVAIMYKCVVHFLPSHKQLPNRKLHPGFVVQHFYDHLRQRVFSIPDEGYYKGSLRKEISVRLRETELRIGDVPNIINEDRTMYQKGFENNEPLQGDNSSTLRNREVSTSHDTQGLDRTDEHISTQQQKMKAQTPPGRILYIKILRLFGVLRVDNRRDMWLERLLEGIHSQWNSIISGLDGRSVTHNSKVLMESGKSQKGNDLIWPDSAVRLVHSLEDETDIAYGTDIQKYNTKMRQLVFNLKSNGVLAKRFVNQELTPSMLLNMTPLELKAGLTTEEQPRNDSDATRETQMVNVHCKRCSRSEVQLLKVVQAGSNLRYQLECDECGASWFTSSILDD